MANIYMANLHVMYFCLLLLPLLKSIYKQQENCFASLIIYSNLLTINSQRVTKHNLESKIACKTGLTFIEH